MVYGFFSLWLMGISGLSGMRNESGSPKDRKSGRDQSMNAE